MGMNHQKFRNSKKKIHVLPDNLFSDVCGIFKQEKEGHKQVQWSIG